jgi:hypothetical protein
VFEAAIAAGVDPNQVIATQEMTAEFCAELERLRDRRRPATRELCRRIALLERQLAHLEPGARAAAIQQRFRISRSRYYQLRPSPETNVDSGLVYRKPR